MVVTLVELKDIQLPETMKRAMARQAEAEREKRAKIIAAEGESLAADQLGAASDIMMAHPLALQLRNLQSLVEIGVDKNTTVVFPAPLMSTIQELGAFLAREQAAGTTPTPAPTTPAAYVHLARRRAAGDPGRVQHRLQRSARRPSVNATHRIQGDHREALSCHAAQCADRPWSPSPSVCTRSPSAPAAAPAGSKTAASSGRSTRSKNPHCSPRPKGPSLMAPSRS